MPSFWKLLPESLSMVYNAQYAHNLDDITGDFAKGIRA